MTDLLATIAPVGLADDLETTRARYAASIEALRSFPCDTPADEQALAEILHRVKSTFAQRDAQRTSITRPLLAVKRAIDDLFRPVLTALEEAEQIIKGKLAAADAARREAQQKALAAAVSAPSYEHITAMAPVAPPPPGVSFRYRWEAVITDFDKVPREFMTVDASKTEAFAKPYSGSEAPPPPVTGLEWRRTSTVVAR